MNIAIIGSTGCIGTHLIRKLSNSSHNIKAFYRNKPGKKAKNIIWERFDLDNDKDLGELLKDVEVVYYLVHSLDQKNFVEKEKSYAKIVNKACIKAKVSRIIYLGGIINEDKHLSDHLLSRKLTGELLASNDMTLIELRASIVLARCSDSYNISSKLAKRLPIMIVPKWLNSYCSPIYIEDLVDALISCIAYPNSGHKIINVGSDKLTYLELVKMMSKAQRGRESIIISTPLMLLKPSFIWVWFITGNDIDLVRHLNESLIHDTSSNQKALEKLIDRKPTTISDALKKLAD